MKLVCVLTSINIVILLGQTSGNPVVVVNGIKLNDDSAVEAPRSGDWITFRPSWTFPSLPPMSRLFQSDAKIGVVDNEMKQMKRRIQILEESLKDIYELLKRIPQNVEFDGALPCHHVEINIPMKKVELQSTTDAITAEKEFPAVITEISSTTTLINENTENEGGISSNNNELSTIVQDDGVTTVVFEEPLDTPTTEIY